MTNPTPVSREDREEATKTLRLFAERIEHNVVRDWKTVLRLHESHSLASAIRIVLEETT